MAEKLTAKELAAIGEAAEIAIGISYSLTALGDFRPDITEEWFHSFRPDAERLEAMLSKPSIGGRLSLANRDRVEVAGIFSVSYAAAVAAVVLRGDPSLIEKIPADTFMRCAKEFERATGKPCNVEQAKSRSPGRPKTEESKRIDKQLLEGATTDQVNNRTGLSAVAIRQRRHRAKPRET